MSRGRKPKTAEANVADVKATDVQEVEVKAEAVKADNAVDPVPEVKKDVKEAKVSKTAKQAEAKEDGSKTEKKATTKKSTEKAAEKKTAEKKTTEKKTAKKETTKKVDEKIVLQLSGHELDTKVLMEKCIADWVAGGHKKSSMKSIELYIKPEEWAVYYVINQYDSGRIGLD